MKFRSLGIMFLLLILVSFFLSACPSKNIPSSPATSAPTNTFTSTPTNFYGYTSTPSFTPTLTFTPTATNPGGLTSTPSSYTPTYTFTSSSTPTFTFTNTYTFTFTCTSTPTNSFTTTNSATSTATTTFTHTTTNTNSPTCSFTPTNTLTPTPTNTVCTDGSGNTCTFTLTATNTLTNTPTNTPTGPIPTYTLTSTPTQTYTPTPDCTGTYSISGTISYIGPTSVGSSLYVGAISNPGGGENNSCNGATVGVSGTSGSYSLTYLPYTSYYVIGFYGVPPGSGPPPLGTFASIYKSGSPTCTLSTSEKVNSTTNPTGINFSFSNTYPLYGINAQVSYTGGQTGKQINVGIFNSSYTTQTTNTGGFTSGTVQSLIDQNNFCNPGATAYVMAWYGTSSSGPQTGDAYDEYGSVTEIDTTTTNVVISFSDTHIW